MGSAVSITLNGMSELQAKTDKLPDKIMESLAKGVNQAEGSAKRLCPVDTGTLRGSIHIMKQATATEPKAVVGTNIEYAPYVEFGTGVRGQATNTNTKVSVSYSSERAGQVAQPYLAPALRNNKDVVEDIINKSVAEGLK